MISKLVVTTFRRKLRGKIKMMLYWKTVGLPATGRTETLLPPLRDFSPSLFALTWLSAASLNVDDEEEVVVASDSSSSRLPLVVCFRLVELLFQQRVNFRRIDVMVLDFVVVVLCYLHLPRHGAAVLLSSFEGNQTCRSVCDRVKSDVFEPFCER